MTNTIQPINLDVNLLQSILWQYENAPNLQAIVQGEQDWYNVNQIEFWQDFYDNIFNLKTCNDFGLTVWSIILRTPLFIYVQTDTRLTWGFKQYHANFTRSNFASGAGGSIPLDTAVSRTILRLRYYQLTLVGAVPEINRMIADV